VTVTLSRRRVLAGLGTVGALAAFGTGATVAMLRDGEPLPPTVASSGDVRFVACDGSRLDALDLSVGTADPTDHDTVTFGVATAPARLVARVCPASGDLGPYLDGEVRVGDASAPFGDLLVVDVDPTDCDDPVTVAVHATLDHLAAAEAGHSGDDLDDLGLTLELYLLQRTATTAAEARAAFRERFGGCDEAVDGGTDRPDDAGLNPAGRPRGGPK
jgi:hypothetical protein